MQHVLGENWSAELDNTIARATDGDFIIVPNASVAQMGRHVRRRVGKRLFFRVDPTSESKFDAPLEMWAEYPNARYSAVSEYGVGMLLSDRPIPSEENRSWVEDARDRLIIFDMYLTPPVTDWRESLRERPEGV